MGNACWRHSATAISHTREREAAVRMTWERLPKRPDQSCLDAGCGRGGTAALVQSERWGQVLGLDIDSETISFAQTAYPSVKFVAADIARAGELFPAQFDIIYAFTLSMHFRTSRLRSARYASPRSLKPFSAFLTTLTEEDSPKHTLRENLKRISGIRFL